MREVLEKDPAYKIDAYEFVFQALWFTQGKLKKSGHLTAKELLLGIKELILNQYGPMAKTVAAHWGVFTTDDFGKIVFNLIDAGLMKKSDDDSPDDFKDVYRFDEEFNVFKIKRPKPKIKKNKDDEKKNILS